MSKERENIDAGDNGNNGLVKLEPFKNSKTSPRVNKREGRERISIFFPA